MAIEARHLNHFITNRNLNEGNASVYNTQMGFGNPFAGKLPGTLSPYAQALVPVKPPMKADSGVTYNVPTAPRKRSTDSLNQITSVPQESNMSDEFLSFLGQDITLQIHQQQLETDHIVAHHAKRIRLEVEEKQKQHARLLVSAIGEGIEKKLKEKEEQIERMSKLNWVLEERVKSLYAENQLWKNFAQTNQATANSLRSNLEQVLAHVSDGRPSAGDDAESCCDNNDCKKDRADEEVERRTFALVAGDKADNEVAAGGGNCTRGNCKRCGEGESTVVLLPCRHLCLCYLCGSSSLLRSCPVCNSGMVAALHVN